jgi:hypothetical protein
MARHRNAILAAMLLLIHGAVWGDFDELQSRSLMLVHLGLFMLWQPCGARSTGCIRRTPWLWSCSS